MGYNNDWIWRDPFGRFVMTVIGLGYWYVFCMFIVVIVSTVLCLLLNNNIGTYLRNHIEVVSFIFSILLLLLFYSLSSFKSYNKQWNLTKEEKETLMRFSFSKMNLKQKKTMARIIRVAPCLMYLRLSRMDFYTAREQLRYKECHLYELNYNDVDLFLKSLPDMEYTVRNETHTLKEWDLLLTEERIKSLKDRIRYERNRIHKYRGKNEDAQQADLLNISYLDYKRYAKFYNGIQKAIEQFGLNSKEVKQAIYFALDRVGDLQEWKDFIDSKSKLPITEPKEKGRYATFYTNILSNTSDVANIFYTKDSFYVMAYFDNITYEERDTFGRDDVILYLYRYEFAYFLIFEFVKLRFAVPLSIKDGNIDLEKWVASSEDTILVNLVEKNTGTLMSKRELHLKRMNVIKEKLGMQKPFDKAVIDSGIARAINKSLDEMVYNGFVLEVIKGDRNMREGYLRFE